MELVTQVWNLDKAVYISPLFSLPAVYKLTLLMVEEMDKYNIYSQNVTL